MTGSFTFLTGSCLKANPASVPLRVINAPKFL